MTAAVQTRRVSAGIRPEPGATSRRLAWWGRGHWLDVDVPEALDANPDVLKGCHVARDTVLAVARAMAGFADHRTGRNCRPTHARLTTAARCSQSTVQRAQRALKRLGLLAELVRGRSILTRSERLAAWERGSSHRQIASEFALLSLPRRRSRSALKKRATSVRNALGCKSAGPLPVDRDHPTGALAVKGVSHLGRTLLQRRTENEEGRSAPRSYRGSRDGRARRLAEATRDRIGWLNGQSWKRLAPALAKVARLDWTVADVELALKDVLAIRGHRVPRDLKHPAAYLANLLRDVDPAGVRPTVEAAAYEAHLKAEAAAERAGRRARVLAIAGKCAHGVPANGAGQPSRGVPACPACSGSIAP